MKAENIAHKARISLGNYCAEECSAYCCRKGYLILTKSQKELVAIDRETCEMSSTGADGKARILYSMKLSPKCPRLNEDFTCSIHKNRNRPKACRDFPLFISGNNVLLSSRCPAVRLGKLFPYVKRLQMMGYTVIKGHMDSNNSLIDAEITFENGSDVPKEMIADLDPTEIKL